MAILSRLLFGSSKILCDIKGSVGKLLVKNNTCAVQNQGATRCMSEHNTMDITPSRWQWHRTKDWMHFYFFVGAIPVTLITLYCNIFIGPATLEEIPEGYIPKQWEYYRSPITRALSRYAFPKIQMEYEKYLHRMQVAHNKRQMRKLRFKMQELVDMKGNYRYWSFRTKALDYLLYIREHTKEFA